MSAVQEIFTDLGNRMHGAHMLIVAFWVDDANHGRRYTVFAGKDASYGLATMSLKPHEADMPIDNLSVP